MSRQSNANDSALRRIEAALRTQAAIRDCALTTHSDRTGAQQVVAYVVASGSPAPGEWDAALAARLPDQPRPDAYVAVTSLPLDERGVVDDAALSRLPVLDEDLRRGWEERLRA